MIYSVFDIHTFAMCCVNFYPSSGLATIGQ